jgi:Spy/CpxP family protein refolding chaperone
MWRKVMKRRVQVMVAVVVLVGALSGVAVAGPREEMRARAELLARLEISPEQKSAIADILKTYREPMRAASDELIAARKELASAINADGSTEAAVRRACRAVAASEESLVVLRARLVKDVRGVLTDAQKAKLAEHRTEAEDRLEAGIGTLRKLFDGWIDRHAAG